jgi:pimeloyl-ACP methyl ester carboxylesterase
VAGSEQPLILLSGLLSDETIWSDVAALLGSHAKVSILAFPNFGSIVDMAHHVLAKSPSQFALAGHSMGGRVALEVVRLAPARVSKLGLFNTGTHPRRDSELKSRGRLVELARSQGMAALAAEWLPPMMGSGEQRRAQVLPRLIQMVERATPDSFAAQTQALLNRPDGAIALNSVRVPTLLASGSADTWSPISQHELMRQALPTSTLVTIQDAGHMAPIEQPEAVSAAMAAWLTNL